MFFFVIIFKKIYWYFSVFRLGIWGIYFLLIRLWVPLSTIIYLYQSGEKRWYIRKLWFLRLLIFPQISQEIVFVIKGSRSSFLEFDFANYSNKHFINLQFEAEILKSPNYTPEKFMLFEYSTEMFVKTVLSSFNQLVNETCKKIKGQRE